MLSADPKLVTLGADLEAGGGFVRAVSDDGQLVAFTSDSPEVLAASDFAGDRPSQIHNRLPYLRDLRTGRLELLVTNPDGSVPRQEVFIDGMSADGRVVVLTTMAPLIEGHPDCRIVYALDRASGELTPLSVAPDGRAAWWADGRGITPDGRYVLMEAGGSLDPDRPLTNEGQVHVYDLQTGAIDPVSVSAEGAWGDAPAEAVAISDDGRFVAFRSNASNLPPFPKRYTGLSYVRDRLSGRTELFRGGNLLDISGDGRYLVHRGVSGDTTAVLRRDRLSGEDVFVAAAPHGKGLFEGAKLSADGRVVAFQSGADELVAGDDNGVQDAFVRDLAFGEVRRLSERADGTGGDARSFIAGLSANGRHAVFTSAADNLSTADDNGSNDGFLATVDLPGLDPLPVTAARIPEHAAAGTVVARVPRGVWIADGNAAGAFEIDAFRGRLVVRDGTPLDFDRVPVINLTLGSPAGTPERVVRVELAPVDEAPAIADQTFSTGEGVPSGTRVGVVAAADPDAGDAPRFRILGGNEDGAFALDPEGGGLTVARAAALDAAKRPEVELLVEASDADAPTLRATATVRVRVREVRETEVTGDRVDGPFTPVGRRLSADGRFVAYWTKGVGLSVENLVDGRVRTVPGTEEIKPEGFAAGGDALVYVSAGGMFLTDFRTAAAGRRLLAADELGNRLSGLVLDSGGQVVSYTFRSSLDPSRIGTFVLDVRTGASHRVSAGGLTEDGRYEAVQVLADGRVLLSAYVSHRERHYFLYDPATQAAEPVLAGDGSPRIYGVTFSGDGRTLAYSTYEDTVVDGLRGAVEELIVRDVATGGESLVVRNAGHVYGPEGRRVDPSPSLSDDGRYLAFASSEDLGDGDGTPGADAYVLDRETGRVALASVASDGTQIRNVGEAVRISGNGRTVAFDTFEWGVFGVRAASYYAAPNPLPPRPALLTRDAATGEWLAVRRGDRDRADYDVVGRWAGGDAYAQVLRGDFDGDGVADFAGREADTGDWVVSLVAGGRLGEPAVWSAGTGADAVVGDFNGDGRDDLAWRDAATGEWSVAASDGGSFTTGVWGGWIASRPWSDAVVGDFDGDGRDDLLGHVRDGTGVFVSRGGDGAFTTARWAGLSRRSGWDAFRVGDFDGDGRDDLLARRTDSGTLFAGVSDGAALSWRRAGGLSTNVGWAGITVADFTGDGRADIAARVVRGPGGRPGSGNWYVYAAAEGGFGRAAVWGGWSAARDWSLGAAADVDRLGGTDLVGRLEDNGGLYLSRTAGGRFETGLFARLDPRQGDYRGLWAVTG